jgi:hypothetical protein
MKIKWNYVFTVPVGFRRIDRIRLLLNLSKRIYYEY